MNLFGTEVLKGKTQPITYNEVSKSYQKVKGNKGAAGVDGKTLAEYDQKRLGELYQLWNRLASGSYFPQGVRGVEIPKKDGSSRLLGIPTVADRIAQQVAKSAIEPILEREFHADSYGYRPGKSAHKALEQCERRSRVHAWVLDLDIKGFFDNIDHDLLMEMLASYIDEEWVLMYVKRWLKSPMQLPDGKIEERKKGTPQGGVISPLLANLFLHEVFDKWIGQYCETSYGKVCWERYADDIVIHCNGANQAIFLLNRIKERFASYGLELHPKKTKIVFCKQANRRGSYEVVSFDFLGHTFRPRRKQKQKSKLTGNHILGYGAGLSKKARKHLISQIRRRKIQRATGANLQEIASSLAPMLRGWINYYRRFCAATLREVFSALNTRLVRWLTNKYKRYRRRTGQAIKKLRELSKDYPNLFVHWQYGYTP
jgi:RNA-directed DNA polymerase